MTTQTQEEKYLKAYEKFNATEITKKATLDAEVTKAKLGKQPGWEVAESTLLKKYKKNVGARRRRFDLAWADAVEQYQHTKQAEDIKKEADAHAHASYVYDSDSDTSYAPSPESRSYPSTSDEEYSSAPTTPDASSDEPTVMELQSTIARLELEAKNLRDVLSELGIERLAPICDFAGNIVEK